MNCPPHPPWLDHSNYTWRRVRVMKLLIMQFSPTSCQLSKDKIIKMRYKEIQFCLLFRLQTCKSRKYRECLKKVFGRIFGRNYVIKQLHGIHFSFRS
jgi:hypothetical protein